jgi:Protein of unknown function (DUF3617)
MRWPKSFVVGASSVAVVGLCTSSLAATVSVEPGLYELTAQTILPHLEENLRYATTRHRQCLGTQEASALFPLLRHEAFAGCSLVHESSSGAEAHFSLRCSNPQAATGAAHFEVQSSGFQATLYVKMGGKNMTLSQRLNAPRLGACAGAEGSAPPSALAKLAQTGEAFCQPTQPAFCSNMHVSCSGQTSIKTFPFKLRANISHGTMESAREPEGLQIQYENARVEWDPEGTYVILFPHRASGYIKLLSDGTYSFRHYSQHNAVMSIGRCN